MPKGLISPLPQGEGPGMGASNVLGSKDTSRDLPLSDLDQFQTWHAPSSAGFHVSIPKGVPTSPA
jgi:hypothetical protein